MEFKTFVFYFLSAILVFAGLRVITSRNPVHAALFLVLAFFRRVASGCCCRPSSWPSRWS
jgi:NADH:ubiquinone oxidoreductase subunit 6 (subunit J)